jgi:hypothetical protein
MPGDNFTKQTQQHLFRFIELRNFILTRRIIRQLYEGVRSIRVLLSQIMNNRHYEYNNQITYKIGDNSCMAVIVGFTRIV